MSDDFFTPPPFKPDEALMQLKRMLRELRPLTERGSGFELAGRPIVQLQREDRALVVQLAKHPARTPQWERLVLTSSADVRRCVDEVKKRLTQWIED